MKKNSDEKWEKETLTEILKPNEITASTKASMKTRIITAVVALLVFLPCLFIGDWVWFGLTTVIVGAVIIEILNCAKRSYNLKLYITVLLMTLLLTYWPMFRNLIVNGVDANAPFAFAVFGQNLYLSILILVLLAFLLFFLTIRNEEYTVRDACFIFTMVVLVSLGCQSMLYLRYLPASAAGLAQEWTLTIANTVNSSTLMIYILLGAFLADGGAYFVGVFFGKNKLNERISPKKTWEGFIGGTIISTLCSFTFGILLAYYNNPMVYGVFDMQHWYLILVLSILIPLFAALGDLVFSSIKRYYGIKDYGKILPGHGGVLDRFDSLFFAFIVSAIFVYIAYSALKAEKDPLWYKEWWKVILPLL